MKVLQPILSGVLLVVSMVACVTSATEDPESAPSSVAVPTADKVEIDPAGKVRCDKPAADADGVEPGNGQCFSADRDHCKSGDYSGACYCTHCEGGDFCETESDHKKHDEKCKLKGAADVFALEPVPAEMSTATDPP